MKTRFRVLLHLFVAAMLLTLVWSVWASSPETPSTNTVVQAAPTPQDNLFTLGLDRVPWLQGELFGVQRWKYLAALIYVFLAFYSSKIIDFVIIGQLKRWAAKTATNLDDLLLDLVRGPIKVVSFVILLHVGIRLFSWPPWVEDYMSKGLRVIVAWSLTYTVLKAVDVLIKYWRSRLGADTDRVFDDHLFPIISKSTKAFIAVLAILLTCQNLGLNITSLLASLSIGGLALGLAAQDTVANLFGAVAIFMDKPFRIGDVVRVDSVHGTVEMIGLRSTRVRNLDGHLITVPNKTMGNAIVTNITLRPNIKTEMNIGITYDTPVEKVEQAIQILERHFQADPKTKDLIVSFNRFADSSLNLYVAHWWDGTDWKEYMAGLQKLNLGLMRKFNEAGINFAFPTQTLYLKQDSEWRMQPTVSRPGSQGLHD